MKFSLFAHMERIDSDQSHAQLYEEFIALCEIADAGGIHTIWTGEHHAMDFTIAPNPFITIVDLARRTKNVRLGTGTVVAPFWHPIKLAGEAAMTDVISNGRLELGLARGAYSFEYERMRPGLDATSAGLRLREMVPAIKQLWAGNYVHDGAFHQFPLSSSSPKPLQDGGPPIWIAARDQASHDFALANGCNVQVTPLSQGDGEIEALMQRFTKACSEVTDAKRPKIMLLQHAYIASDADDVVRGANALSRFYCHFGAWFKNERPVSQALIQPLSEAEMAAMAHFAPDKMLENLAIGTPKTVVERLKAYEQLGYDEYAYWIDCGMPFAAKKASLERFIGEVIPAFT
ncbi:MAG: LLM class flavin-dependent oxidoreductase [Hyphomicrobiaceae bacterium]